MKIYVPEVNGTKGLSLRYSLGSSDVYRQRRKTWHAISCFSVSNFSCSLKQGTWHCTVNNTCMKFICDAANESMGECISCSGANAIRLGLGVLNLPAGSARSDEKKQGIWKNLALADCPRVAIFFPAGVKPQGPRREVDPWMQIFNVRSITKTVEHEKWDKCHPRLSTFHVHVVCRSYRRQNKIFRWRKVNPLKPDYSNCFTLP